MIDDYIERRGEALFDIKVKGTKYGHRTPWPSGTVVTFADHMSVVGGQGYKRLDVYEKEDDRFVKLPYESIGVVTADEYAIDSSLFHLDVQSGRITGPSALVHQWYWVAFRDELLWVRCDWLRPYEPKKRS